MGLERQFFQSTLINFSFCSWSGHNCKILSNGCWSFFYFFHFLYFERSNWNQKLFLLLFVTELNFLLNSMKTELCLFMERMLLILFLTIFSFMDNIWARREWIHDWEWTHFYCFRKSDRCGEQPFIVNFVILEMMIFFIMKVVD